jgi:hypothetical protein
MITPSSNDSLAIFEITTFLNLFSSTLVSSDGSDLML